RRCRKLAEGDLEYIKVTVTELHRRQRAHCWLAADIGSASSRVGVHERTIVSVLGWSTTAMASRYTHVITPIHSDLASRLDGLLWSSRDASIGPIETTFETTAKNAGAHLAVRPAFGLVGLAVAAGFEPAEGCPSRAFEARYLGRSDT